jgi:hypothetical protein
VRLFQSDGRQRWRASTPSVAWLVNLSADGRFVVAALGDGTIRWYRSDTGKLALSLFVHPDGQRWMQWTPEGFYDASPVGADLFGYHLNNGRDQAGTFIRASQLQQKFFRPDLIARRLGGDEAAAAAQVGDVRQTLNTASVPPQLTILSRRTLSDGDLEISCSRRIAAAASERWSCGSMGPCWRVAAIRRWPASTAAGCVRPPAKRAYTCSPTAAAVWRRCRWGSMGRGWPVANPPPSICWRWASPDIAMLP